MSLVDAGSELDGVVTGVCFLFQEELAEGLHLIDFEQLKIENQTYNEKIEERNEVGAVVTFMFFSCNKLLLSNTY